MCLPRRCLVSVASGRISAMNRMPPSGLSLSFSLRSRNVATGRQSSTKKKCFTPWRARRAWSSSSTLETGRTW